jgi:predicted nucleic acid-binding protein
MRLVVADTSAWVALGNINDSNHKRAAAFMGEIIEENATLVSPDYVLDETFTLLMSRGVFAFDEHFLKMGCDMRPSGVA